MTSLDEVEGKDVKVEEGREIYHYACCLSLCPEGEMFVSGLVW